MIEMRIKHGAVVVEKWFKEAPNVCKIGVCGSADIGKITLLQNVYNTYKVSYVLDIVLHWDKSSDKSSIIKTNYC